MDRSHICEQGRGSADCYPQNNCS